MLARLGNVLYWTLLAAGLSACLIHLLAAALYPGLDGWSRMGVTAIALGWLLAAWVIGRAVRYTLAGV